LLNGWGSAERPSSTSKLVVSVAPLHLLWQIADLLRTDLTLLIPSREELLPPATQVRLDKEMIKQIEEAANGDPGAIKVLTGVCQQTESDD
jgi:hypothetical protein